LPARPTLRPLTLADAAPLFALDQRCFQPGIAYSKAEIKEILAAAPRGFHVALEQDGALLGFILTLHHGGRGHVITLDVAPEHRRQGAGQTLMQAAEDFYRRHGARGMRLEVAINNHPALRFYATLGYRAIRTLPRYYTPTLDAQELHKDFPPAAPPQP